MAQLWHRKNYHVSYKKWGSNSMSRNTSSQMTSCPSNNRQRIHKNNSQPQLQFFTNLFTETIHLLPLPYMNKKYSIIQGRISRKYTISGKLQRPKISREGCTDQTSTLALFPARMSEISNPRLKAWLNRSRDWKVEMNGNHDKNAIGAKMSIPIPASYILANSLTESHKPRLLTIFFQVMASCLGTTNSD